MRIIGYCCFVFCSTGLFDYNTRLVQRIVSGAALHPNELPYFVANGWILGVVGGCGRIDHGLWF